MARAARTRRRSNLKFQCSSTVDLDSPEAIVLWQTMHTVLIRSAKFTLSLDRRCPFASSIRNGKANGDFGSVQSSLILARLWQSPRRATFKALTHSSKRSSNWTYCGKQRHHASFHEQWRSIFVDSSLNCLSKIVALPFISFPKLHNFICLTNPTSFHFPVHKSSFTSWYYVLMILTECMWKTQN